MAEVVYVTAGRWPGTLVIVTDVKIWGVQGYIATPADDNDGGYNIVARIYVRIVNGAFVRVGSVDLLCEDEGCPESGTPHSHKE